jgi:hypothetical protein
MAPQDHLLMVFCLIDDEMKALGLTRLRSRGPRRTTLADSEVITIELVGEFWGIADDKALYRYFRRHYAAEFPGLCRVHRTTFARQAANLCWAKQLIPRRLSERLSRPEEPWLIDSLPVPVCRFARARTCKRFAGAAAWGFDPVAVKAFYGFRLHLRTSPEGVILGYQLAPADAAETEVIWEVAPAPLGMGLGDRNYWSPAVQAAFQAAGGRLVAPFKTARHDPDPRRSHWLLRLRRRIEHAIGQLVERFDCRRIRVRDLWHLEHRLIRKILSHTVAVWLNVKQGHEPLQFDLLAA